MRRLENLHAYKLARSVSHRAYAATMKPPLKHHFRLAEQIRGCAASVPANVVEGYALSTRPQLVRHLRIAFGSATELKCHLELAEANCLLGDAGAALIKDSDRLVAILIGLLRSLGARVPH